MVMQILDDMRQEKCVYWEPKGTDSFGNPINRNPRELDVRWEERLQVIKTDDGRTVMSKATVYYDSDETKLQVSGKLAYGTLGELASTNPKCEETAFEILKLDRIPTIEADQFLRIAYL